MNKLKSLINLKTLIFVISFLLFINLFCFLLIKFSGNIAGLFSDQAGRILLQLKDSKILLPFYIPVVFLLINLVIFLFLKNHKGLVIFLTILNIFICVLLTILLTKSNGISLIRIVVRLLSILSKGGIQLWRNDSFYYYPFY